MIHTVNPYIPLKRVLLKKLKSPKIVHKEQLRMREMPDLYKARWSRPEFVPMLAAKMAFYRQLMYQNKI